MVPKPYSSMTEGICSCSFEPAQVEDALAVIKAHLGKLEKSFMAATEEKTRVEGQARACQERLGLAERYVLTTHTTRRNPHVFATHV